MFFVDLYMKTLSLLIMTTRDVNDAAIRSMRYRVCKTIA